MKRSVQMAKASIPSAGQRSRFKGFRKQRPGVPPTYLARK